jgi:GNAT superfamily N-acetyltransferase
MKISPLSASDIEEMVRLGKLNWSESRFGRLPFDEARIRANLQRMAETPASANCALVARNAVDRLVGYLIGTIEEYFFCRERVATSVFLFVDPTDRGGLAAVKLILAFRQWALNRGAVELYIGIAGGVLVERTGRFLQRLGMRHTGGNYSLWLAGPSASPATAAGGGLRQEAGLIESPDAAA